MTHHSITDISCIQSMLDRSCILIDLYCGLLHSNELDCGTSTAQDIVKTRFSAVWTSCSHANEGFGAKNIILNKLRKENSWLLIFFGGSVWS